MGIRLVTPIIFQHRSDSGYTVYGAALFSIRRTRSKRAFMDCEIDMDGGGVSFEFTKDMCEDLNFLDPQLVVAAKY